MSRQITRWMILFCSFFGILLVSQLWSCTEPPPPAPILPEIEVNPEGWNITEEKPAGLRSYKKFTIRNKIAPAPNAVDLDVKSIKLTADSSTQFKLIEDTCPIGADEECVTFPSLPFKLKPGETKTFSMEFTYSNSNDFQLAKVQIVSNSRNVDDPSNPDDVTTEIRAQTPGGEPVIDVSAEVAGPREFRMGFGETAKGSTKKQTLIIGNGATTGVLEFSFSWSKEDPATSFVVKDNSNNPIELGKMLKIEPRNSLSFTVEYTPSTCSTHEAALTINSNSIFRPGNANEGIPPAASQLVLNLLGRSPAKGSVSPQLIQFSNVAVGASATQTFILKQRADSSCDFHVFNLDIKNEEGKGPADPAFSLGKMRKDGQEVPPPSQGTPIILTQGQELEVEIVFAPTQQAALQAIITAQTNDPDLTDTNTGSLISLLAGTEVNIPPFARFKFICAEVSGNVCKNEGDPVPNPTFLGGERPLVKLDPSDSFDREGKIVGYKWELLPPVGSSSKLSSDTEQMPTFRIDGRGEYKVTLEVTDEGGLKGTKSETLNAQD